MHQATISAVKNIWSVKSRIVLLSSPLSSVQSRVQSYSMLWLHYGILGFVVLHVLVLAFPLVVFFLSCQLVASLVLHILLHSASNMVIVGGPIAMSRNARNQPSLKVIL